MNIRQSKIWIVAAGLGLASATPALAEHEVSDGYQYAYANVVDVQPIVRYVTVESPVRECYTVNRVVKTRRNGGNAAGATLAGAIIGGVIGNQFGSGSGRAAATAAGVVIGSSIASDNARRNTTGARVRQPVKQCDISYETHEEERIDGYRVTYVYRGTEYRTRMQRHPGERIKVRVLVEPVSRG
ncbi:MAG: glycine zipper 2TM domain-containing protein [Gammaproteobacteria bacterium]|nr:glycine zipper 2TM domain-containing protein [Gammaproteobacteria bacterium]